MPPLVYAASSLLRIFLIPYMLRERSEPDLRRRVIALRSATGFRPTKVLVANQHSGRDTGSTAGSPDRSAQMRPGREHSGPLRHRESRAPELRSGGAAPTGMKHQPAQCTPSL